MNENKNLILAVVLSALVLLGWSFLSEKFVPANPPPVKVENGKVQPHAAAAGTARSRQHAGPRCATAPSFFARTPRVRIQTPSLQGSINLQGARIDDLWLLKQHVTLSPRTPRRCGSCRPQGARASLSSSSAGAGQDDAPPADTRVDRERAGPFAGQAGDAELDQPRPASASSSSISVDDQSTCSRSSSGSSNPTGQPIQVRAVQLFEPRRPVRRLPTAGPSTSGRSASATARPIMTSTGRPSRRGSRQASNSRPAAGWLGFTDKYWLTALAPAGHHAISPRLFRKAPSGAYQADCSGLRDRRTGQGGHLPRPSLFAGAKEKALLDRYEKAGITKISKAIDWGWFEWFMRPIFDLLNWLFKQIGNFGVAIICLTLIVRGLMFPIAAEAVPVDGGDAQAPAEDEGDPGALQGRQAEAAAGDAEAVPAGEDQSGRGLPSDPAPDPDLLRALQGAAGLASKCGTSRSRCGSRT